MRLFVIIIAIAAFPFADAWRPTAVEAFHPCSGSRGRKAGDARLRCNGGPGSEMFGGVQSPLNRGRWAAPPLRERGSARRSIGKPWDASAACQWEHAPAMTMAHSIDQMVQFANETTATTTSCASLDIPFDAQSPGVACTNEAKSYNESILEKTLSGLKFRDVTVPHFVAPREKVRISYAEWKPCEHVGARGERPVIILLHGYDCSCLEFRHLGPRLASAGYHVYAPDILGWGFSQLDGVECFSSNAKVVALVSFLREVVCNDDQKLRDDRSTAAPLDLCVIGASLGGAMTVELLSRLEECDELNDEARIKYTVWISAQVLFDGTRLKLIPRWYGKVLVKLLKIPFFRRIVEYIGYHNRTQFFSPSHEMGISEGDEALAAWTLQTNRSGWEESQLSFMATGGFAPSKKISAVKDIPSLIIFGKNDRILGRAFSKRLNYTLQHSHMVQIPHCGHFPHIEEPNLASRAIINFLEEHQGKLGHQ